MAASKRKKQGGGKPGAAQAPAGAPTGDASATRAGVAPGSRGGAAEDVERSPQDIILENLPAIVVVLLVAMGLTALAVHRGNTSRAVSDVAWSALGEAKANADSTAEDFQKLYREHEGTSAAPYIQLAWAAKLYASGEKEKVEQARDLFKQLVQRHGDLPLIRDTVPGQIQQIDAELADASIPWAAAAAQATREPEAGAPAAVGGDDHEGHDHEGHDHGDEPAPEQPAEDGAPAVGGDDHEGHDHGDEPAPEQPAEGGQQ